MAMNDATTLAMTGMPAGRKLRSIRRGGGRHKAETKATTPKPSTTADTHHDAVNAAMARGDHAAAKSSALMLAKALHLALAKKAPKPTNDPDDSSATTDLSTL